MENIQDLKNEAEDNGKITGYNDPITGRFVRGNRGRPFGSKNKRFTDEIDELLDEMAEGKDYTYRKALKKQIIKRMIIDGDTGLIKEYWQQKDGKPLQRVANADGSNIDPIIKINYYQPDGKPKYSSDPEATSSLSSSEKPPNQ